MVNQAGIHFLMPLGFEITPIERTGELGAFSLFLLEPRNGVVSGQPNSAFFVLESYQHSPHTLAAVMANRVDILSDTFGGDEPVSAIEADYELGGQTAHGVRLSWRLAGVELVGHLVGQQEGDTILIVYYQGQPAELEALQDTFDVMLESTGFGEASPPDLQPMEGTGG
jgi:hypothetical protein